MKYDQITINTILSSLREGEGRVRACKAAGIDYQTFLNWYKDKSKKLDWETPKVEFFEAVKKAESCGNNKIKDLAKRGVIEKFTENWQAAAWWLERKYPEEFSLRQKIDHTTKGKKLPEQVMIDLNKLPDELVRNIIQHVKQSESQQS